MLLLLLLLNSSSSICIGWATSQGDLVRSKPLRRGEGMRRRLILWAGCVLTCDGAADLGIVLVAPYLWRRQEGLGGLAW